MTRIFTRRFAANYLSTLAFIGLSYWIVFHLSDFHRNMLQSGWDLGPLGINAFIGVQRLFITLIVVYAIILVPYYALYPWLHSKSATFIRGLWFALLRAHRRRPPRRAPLALPLSLRLSPQAKQAGLALLLKFFFAPLMINWCLGHIATLSGSTLQLIAGIQGGLSGRALFDSSIFWAAFQLILFVDTFLFTLGYIIEVPALHNRIRTVDPTFFGWFICLCCYPPFNGFTGQFFEWQSNDFPYFESTALHLAVNIVLLLALAVFSWASIALGFKASNLTNRGIVSHGPYAIVRHPAYVAKNFAWWLGALPTLATKFSQGGWLGLVYPLIALVGWSTIYALRAITEERHLLLIDNGYAEYARKVRWRFIPGVC